MWFCGVARHVCKSDFRPCLKSGCGYQIHWLPGGCFQETGTTCLFGCENAIPKHGYRGCLTGLPIKWVICGNPSSGYRIPRCMFEKTATERYAFYAYGLLGSFWVHHGERTWMLHPMPKPSSWDVRAYLYSQYYFV